MSKSARTRSSILGFFAILTLSAVTMLWLFWRHPISTAIAALAMLAAFAMSARLARLMDPDGGPDLERMS